MSGEGNGRGVVEPRKSSHFVSVDGQELPFRRRPNVGAGHCPRPGSANKLRSVAARERHPNNDRRRMMTRAVTEHRPYGPVPSVTRIPETGP